MSLLLSLFDQALTPRPQPQPLNDQGPAIAAPANQTNDKLVRSGLLFLLMPKDRYGVWYRWSNVNSVSPRLSTNDYLKGILYVHHRPTR